MILEAPSQEEAATLARKRGLFVSQVHPARPLAKEEGSARWIGTILVATTVVVALLVGGVLWKLLAAKPSSIPVSAPPLSTELTPPPATAAPATPVAPSPATPSGNELAELKAQNAELARKFAELSDRLAKAPASPSPATPSANELAALKAQNAE